MRTIAPVVAFGYLHFVFTFENWVATPLVRWPLALSLEVATGLALLALAVEAGWQRARWVRIPLALVVFIAWLVRYTDRTALGVLGREFNLHGDLPHMHRVAAMFLRSMSWPTAIGALGLVALVVAVPLIANWFAIGTLLRGFDQRRNRLAMFAVAVVAWALSFWAPSRAHASTTEIVVRQLRHVFSDEARLARQEVSGWKRLGLPKDLDRLANADVYLIFLESYGVTLIEDEQHYSLFRARLETFERHLATAGVDYRSHRVQSPTFGGGSWRAHASLMAGAEVRSEHHYNALLETDRPTLARAFSAVGYRTVSLEPGIQWYWPDGEFYGFDKIYNAAEIDYRGPPMGWWKIPDQFTLYRLVESELSEPAKPLFAKLSLIMTHIPYFPIPPYVADWSRFEAGNAYERGLDSIAHDDYRDLSELSERYVHAFEYELDILGDFIIHQARRPSLTIVLGDHQPPKLATHDNDSWAVPIHVFSRDPSLLEAFDSWGFTRTMRPMSDDGLRMDQFYERFVASFESTSSARFRLGEPP